MNYKQIFLFVTIFILLCSYSHKIIQSFKQENINSTNQKLKRNLNHQNNVSLRNRVLQTTQTNTTDTHAPQEHQEGKVENEPHPHEEHEQEHLYTPSQMEFWIYLAIATFLVCFAGICSGLTVGLLSIDEMQLELKLRNGTPEEIQSVERIKPILKDHHVLISTLLLSNALAMEALPIFLEEIVPSHISILISVIAVVVFGEIIPQAYCTSSKQLQIAEQMVPLVKFLIAVTCCITRPIAKGLDRLFGEHHLQKLKRDEIKNVFEMQEGVLQWEEIKLIKSAIDFRDRTVFECMIPIEKVFMLDGNKPFTKETIDKIKLKLYSNILVYEQKKKNIVGLIRTKSLIEMADKTVFHKFKSIMEDIPLKISSDTSLLEMLMMFKNTKREIAIVTSQQVKMLQIEKRRSSIQLEEFKYFSTVDKVISNKNDEKGDILGIITLKDVFEELIQAELEDSDTHNQQFISHGVQDNNEILEKLIYNPPKRKGKSKIERMTNVLDSNQQQRREKRSQVIDDD